MEYLPYFDWNKIYGDTESILNNIDNFQAVLNAAKSETPPLIIKKTIRTIRYRKFKRKYFKEY